MHRLACFILLHISYVLLSFPSFSFLSAILIGWFPLFCLPDHLFTLLCYLVCHLLLLDWFLSHHLSCLILIGSPVYFLVPCYNDLHFHQSSFSIPLAFLLSSFWTWGLIVWWSLFHHLFFHEIYLILLTENGSSAFLFHLNFLCLCEFRRSSYLIGVWRSVRRRCVDCVSPVFLCSGWLWSECQPPLSWVCLLLSLDSSCDSRYCGLQS